MPAFTVSGDRSFMRDDEGRYWNMDFTQEFDPVTFEPINPKQEADFVEELTTENDLPEEVTVAVIPGFACDCGFIAKSNAGLAAHKRKAHKGG